MQGTILGTTSNQFIASKIEWESSVNDDGLSSSVKAVLYYRRTNSGYVTEGWGRFSITVGDQTAVLDGTPRIGENWVKAVEISVTVEHEADGTKIVPMSATGYMSGTSLSATYCSGEAELDAIPRATTIDEFSCSTQYFNGELHIKYTPHSEQYLTVMVLSLDDQILQNYTPDEVSTEQHSYVVSLGEDMLESIYHHLNQTDHGTLRLTTRTYNGDQQIGNDQIADLVLCVPQNEDTLPEFTMTLSPDGDIPTAFQGKYIQRKSRVKAVFDATAKYDAEIVSCTITVSGKTYDGITDVIMAEGNLKVVGTVTDSRGYSTIQETTIYVCPYYSPKIKVAECCRCDQDKQPLESGTYLLINATREFASVDGVNRCAIQYSYIRDDGERRDWTPILSEDAADNTVVACLPGFVVEHSYTVKIRTVDTMGEDSVSEESIPTDEVYWHRDGARRSFSFGEYIQEDNTFAIAPDVKFRPKGGILDLFPIGYVYISVIDINPGELFGGTWERIKDCFLLAAGDKYAAGISGGSDTHTLTVEEMPPHSHEGNIRRNVARVYEGDVTSVRALDDPGAEPTYDTLTLKTGGGQEFSIMPPYLAVYIWKRIV